MGAAASVDERVHMRLFNEGQKAVQEGRYTYAEIYYEQALERHEGITFWACLDEAVEWDKKNSKEKRKKGEGKGQESDREKKEQEKQKREEEKQKREEERRKREEERQQALSKARESNEEGASEVPAAERDREMEEANGEVEEVTLEDEEKEEGPAILEIPLDHRLGHVLDYINLRARIADSYLLANRHEEASPHVEYIFNRTHTLKKCLKCAVMMYKMDEDDEVNEENPFKSGVVKIRALRSNTAACDSVELDSILECFEQNLRVHWVSALVNSVYIAFTSFKNNRSEKKRKRDLDASIDLCLQAEKALYTAAQRRAKSLTNAVVIEFLEAIIHDMDGDSSSTSATDVQLNDTSNKQKSKQRSKSQMEQKGLSGNVSNSANDRKCADFDDYPIAPRLQKLQDRRLLYRNVPAPQQAAALRHIHWMDDEIHRVVPGTNYYLEIQCGLVGEGAKKRLQKRSLKFTPQKTCDYNDCVLLWKSIDEENALLLFPLLLIQASVQLELGAATKGIRALELVEKLSNQLYGADSVETLSLMRDVTEVRKRGGSLFMMFED